MGDIFNQLRTEWSGFFRWTAGVSISLITVTLAVLTFHSYTNPVTKVLAHITTLFFLINVAFTWRLLKLNLFVLKTLAVATVKGEKVDVTEEDTKAKTLEKRAGVFFLLGILFFIVYLITYKGIL